MGFRQHLTKGDAHGTKVSASLVEGMQDLAAQVHWASEDSKLALSRVLGAGVALRLTGSRDARPKPPQAREWRRCSQLCGRQTPRPAAAPRSLRSADPLCTATWSVLSLSMTYCGSSLEARTV